MGDKQAPLSLFLSLKLTLVGHQVGFEMKKEKKGAIQTSNLYGLKVIIFKAE
jgi:hypothetical protein